MTKSRLVPPMLIPPMLSGPNTPSFAGLYAVDANQGSSSKTAGSGEEAQSLHFTDALLSDTRWALGGSPRAPRKCGVIVREEKAHALPWCSPRGARKHRSKPLFTIAILFVVLLGPIAWSGCGNGGSDGVEPPMPTPTPSVDLTVDNCTSAEDVGVCKGCAVGFYCCTVDGGCWDPTQGDNCQSTKCYSGGACDTTEVCERTKPPLPTGSHKFTFVNNSQLALWVAGYNDDPRGNPVESGGWNWELLNGASQTIEVPALWSGRFWARTGCTPGTDGALTCQTGDCNGLRNCLVTGSPPASLAEFTLDGGAVNPGGADNYDVSFVDGWTVMITVQPNVTAGSGSPPSCGTAGCTTPPACPSAFRSASGCESPCQVDGTEKNCCVCSLTNSCKCGDNCCIGGYGCSPFNPANPEKQICDPFGTKRPDAEWSPTNQSYITSVHASCPTVYAWQFDDTEGDFSCQSPGNLVDYTITFLPGYLRPD